MLRDSYAKKICGLARGLCGIARGCRRWCQRHIGHVKAVSRNVGVRLRKTYKSHQRMRMSVDGWRTCNQASSGNSAIHTRNRKRYRPLSIACNRGKSKSRTCRRTMVAGRWSRASRQASLRPAARGRSRRPRGPTAAAGRGRRGATRQCVHGDLLRRAVIVHVCDMQSAMQWMQARHRTSAVSAQAMPVRAWNSTPSRPAFASAITQCVFERSCAAFSMACRCTRTRPTHM